MSFKTYTELRIESIFEHIEKRDYRKKEDGSWDYAEINHGWFIRCLGTSAIGPFDEKPDLKIGDTVIMRLEKKLTEDAKLDTKLGNEPPVS